MRRPTPPLLGGLFLFLLLVGGGVTAFMLPAPSSISTKPLVTRAPAIFSSTRSPTPITTTSCHGRCAPLRAQDDVDNDGDSAAISFFAQRGTVRPVITALVWLGFVIYAFNFAPGTDEAARSADQKLLMDLIADPLAPTVTPLFAMVRF